MENFDELRDFPIRLSRLEGPYDVTDDGPAERTVAAALAPPLLDGAFVAHAHVTAGVQHGVDLPLVADGTVGALGGRDGIFRPFADAFGRVDGRMRETAYGLEKDGKLLRNVRKSKQRINRFIILSYATKTRIFKNSLLFDNYLDISGTVGGEVTRIRLVTGAGGWRQVDD